MKSYVYDHTGLVEWRIHPLPLVHLGIVASRLQRIGMMTSNLPCLLGPNLRLRLARQSTLTRIRESLGPTKVVAMSQKAVRPGMRRARKWKKRKTGIQAGNGMNPRLDPYYRAGLPYRLGEDQRDQHHSKYLLVNLRADIRVYHDLPHHHLRHYLLPLHRARQYQRVHLTRCFCLECHDGQNQM